MQLRKLFDDDDAVSPVIGVILMVAITVILAAVIATFVLGLGEQVSQTAPQASFSFDYNDGYTGTDDYSNSVTDGVLNITHAGGATLTAGNLGIAGSSDSSGSWDNAGYSTNSEVAAGDSLSVGVASTDTVQVTWTSDNGQQSATLREWRGPDA